MFHILASENPFHIKISIFFWEGATNLVEGKGGACVCEWGGGGGAGEYWPFSSAMLIIHSQNVGDIIT